MITALNTQASRLNSEETLKNYLTKNPRYIAARVLKKQSLCLMGYDCYFVFPQHEAAINRVIFLVKNNIVYATHKAGVFDTLIREAHRFDLIDGLTVQEFGEFYVTIGLQEVARVLDDIFISHRYRNLFGSQKWSNPSKKMIDSNMHFKFWTADMMSSQVKFHNVLITPKGQLELDLTQTASI